MNINGRADTFLGGTSHDSVGLKQEPTQSEAHGFGMEQCGNVSLPPLGTSFWGFDDNGQDEDEDVSREDIDVKDVDMMEDPPMKDCSSQYDRSGNDPSENSDSEKSSAQDSEDGETPDGGSDTSNDQPTEEEKPHLQDALALYNALFPGGHEIVPTSGEDLLCGFAAVINTIKHMCPWMPTPTIQKLKGVFHSPAMKAHAEAFGLTNEDYFHVDQVGVTLLFWGMSEGLNLQIGVVHESGSPPQLLPHPNEAPRHVVWIRHQKGESGCLAHFSGLKSKPCPARFWK